MSRASDNAKIDARIAHRRAKDKRRKIYRCACGKLTDQATVSMAQVQARMCGECYRTSCAEG